ncbi:MAG: hypothetical protein WC225_01530 [Acholeplasmataceae bacterium]|nr:hypothetical protein [Acholeplasmataceae bacterium]
MKSLVKAFDNLPWILKLILALPVLDGLCWGIYRLAKGLATKNLVLIIFGFIWIFVGAVILWIVDIITIIIHKKPTILV